MDNQEKIDNLITVVKTFARKFASIEEKIDTIEVKLDKMRVGIKESILPQLEVCTDMYITSVRSLYGYTQKTKRISII